MKTDKKLVPALRFPEFKENWDAKTLKDITKINQGLQIAIDCRYTEPIKDGYFYITNEFLRKNNKKKYYIKKPPKTVLCEKDDILMTRTGNTGEIVTGVEGVFHNNFFKIKYSCTSYKWFLYYFLISHKTQQTILKLAGTSTIPDLNHGDFYKIKINLPTLPEQQKIASFLLAVDKKIEMLTRKKELLDKYKRGVMQKIFAREIHFKDENGKDYPEWENKQFGDIIKFIPTNSLSRNDLNYRDGEIKNIHYGDIHTRFKTHFDIKKEHVPYINKSIHINNNLQEQYCNLGDIVIADASEDYKDIGKAIEICNLGGAKVVAGLHTLLGRDTTKLVAEGFKGYLLQTFLVRMQIQKMAQGISVLGISKKNILKIKFQLPCVFEQEKIADFLSGIDKKIGSVDVQIDKMKMFKKGLLQKLFV